MVKARVPPFLCHTFLTKANLELQHSLFFLKKEMIN